MPTALRLQLSYPLNLMLGTPCTAPLHLVAAWMTRALSYRSMVHDDTQTAHLFEPPPEHEFGLGPPKVCLWESLIYWYHLPHFEKLISWGNLYILTQGEATQIGGSISSPPS